MTLKKQKHNLSLKPKAFLKHISEINSNTNKDNKMPKKNMTPEERKAWGEKMKAARAAAKEQTPETKVTLTKDQFDEMMQRITDLEQIKKQQPQPQAGSPQIDDKTGQPLGVTEKFSINPNDYRNPIDQLYDLPQLRRYAMRENYELAWNVTPTRYQTAFGTWFTEPRFELTLKQYRFDDDGNVKDRVILGKASFFEDPPANMLEAELAGLTLNDVGTSDFADKMRMFRYQQWLVERLNPLRPGSTKPRLKMEVIGGKAYEVEEGSSVV